MIGSLTSSGTDQYKGVGQQKKLQEKSSNTEIQEKSVSSVKEGSDTSAQKETEGVKGDSFGTEAGKTPRDPEGSRSFVGLQANLSRQITGNERGEAEAVETTPTRESTPYIITPKMEATAEPEMPRLKTNEKVNIFGDSPEGLRERQNLLRNCSQFNEVSEKANNSTGLCAASSLTGALILDSKNPEAAKKNADAIISLYNSNSLKDPNTGKPMKLSEEDRKVLEHLKSGNMSPKDTYKLQQTMERTLQGIQKEEDGISGPHMASAVNMLRNRGAFSNSDSVTFHNNDMKGAGYHWTVTVDKSHYDPGMGGSEMSVEVNPPASVKVDGAPPGLTKTKDGTWGGDVSFTKNSKTRVEWAGVANDPNRYVTYDMGKEDTGPDAILDKGEFRDHTQ